MPIDPVLSAEASQSTPFRSLSWQQWLETRAQLTRCLELFVSAAREQRADQVVRVGMEMQELVGRMLLEAYVMSADLGLAELPR